MFRFSQSAAVSITSRMPMTAHKMGLARAIASVFAGVVALTFGAGVGMADAASATTTSAASAAHASAPATDGTILGGLYGNVVLVKPVGEMRGFVVLYSDREGWQPADQKAAEALAAHGAMVVGVDTPRYAATLAQKKESPSGCHYLVGDAEAVSHQLQREAHSSRYFLPIVVGMGQGALVAERTLGRAPSNTLSGAVVIDPDAKLDARFNPCVPDPTIDRGDGLTGFLSMGAIGAHHAVPAITTGSKAIATHHFVAGTDAAEALLTLVKPHLTAVTVADDDVSDLPLVTLPAAQPSDMMAIVISGDGGWRDLDKTIAESLQKKGVQVVGVDALRYFWSAKSPQQTAHDMVRVIAVYGHRWHTRHIALIGYSFGADVMPFIYNRLPDDLRAQVSQVSLLGFASKADFQIRVTGWLGLPASNAALPVLPETDKMPVDVLQCFYGESEDDTACPELVKRGVTVIKTDGGHHFGGDYGDLASEILTRWKAQIAKQPN